MKIIRNILFGVIYTVIYFFLAVMGTGGGHGNFYLLFPLPTWIFIFIALILLTRLENSLVRIFGSVSKFMLINIAVSNIQIQHRIVHFFVL